MEMPVLIILDTCLMAAVRLIDSHLMYRGELLTMTLIGR